jgi:type I DNA specificity S subunit
MSKVPKLRFPEFEGEWEEKELGEVGDVTASGDLEADSFSKELTEQHIYPIYSNAIVDEGLYGYSTHFKHLPNSITITARGTLGVAFVRQTKFTGIGRLLVVSNIVNSDASFLKENWNFLAKIPFENGGIPQLTAVKAKAIKLLYPSLEEQQKIADCLSALDEQITAEEEALEALENYKKGLLQQLFPEGVSKSTPPPLIFNKLPKLRFEGFEGEWEEVKLGEICNITNGKANVQDHIEGGRYPLFDRSEVVKASNEYFLDCETVILPGEGVRFTPKYYKGKFNLHQRAYALKDFSCSGLFLYYAIYAKKDLLATKAVQSTVLSLRLPILQNFEICIPVDIAEQEKIANCLSSLDELIEAKNEKIKLLKSYKKGLLQQMFVN